MERAHQKESVPPMNEQAFPNNLGAWYTKLGFKLTSNIAEPLTMDGTEKKLIRQWTVQFEVLQSLHGQTRAEVCSLLAVLNHITTTTAPPPKPLMRRPQVQAWEIHANLLVPAVADTKAPSDEHRLSKSTPMAYESPSTRDEASTLSRVRRL